MHLKLFLKFLKPILFCHFITAAPTETTNVLKLSGNFSLNKYASQQLYVFGGLNADGKRQTSASQFNSSTGEWDSINDMKIGKNAFCGAVVGTKIYLFGGNTNSGVLNTAEVYDCETDTYSEYRAFSRSRPRYGCGAAVLNGFIYVAGGSDGSKSYSNVVRYNIQTTRRENVTSMHAEREGFHLIEFHERLYAIGGWTNTVELYDPATDRWSEVASTQYAHGYFGATVHEGKIYVRSNLGFEVYSPEIDQWKTLTSLDNLEASNLVSMNGKLWSLGGGNRTDYKSSKSVFVYNIATNQWNKQFDMDVERMFHSSFVVHH